MREPHARLELSQSFRPQILQMTSVKNVANPMRAAAIQKGVIVCNAISITKNVPPQTKPSSKIASQLVAVMFGLSDILFLFGQITRLLVDAHRTVYVFRAKKAPQWAPFSLVGFAPFSSFLCRPFSQLKSKASCRAISLRFLRSCARRLHDVML